MKSTIFADPPVDRVNEWLDQFTNTTRINAERGAPETTRYTADDYGEIRTTGGTWVGRWEVKDDEGTIEVDIMK